MPTTTTRFDIMAHLNGAPATAPKPAAVKPAKAQPAAKPAKVKPTAAPATLDPALRKAVRAVPPSTFAFFFGTHDPAQAEAGIAAFLTWCAERGATGKWQDHWQAYRQAHTPKPPKPSEKELRKEIGECPGSDTGRHTLDKSGACTRCGARSDNALSAPPPPTFIGVNADVRNRLAALRPAKDFPRHLAAQLLSLSYERQVFPYGDKLADLRRDVLQAINGGDRPSKAKAGSTLVRDSLVKFFGITEWTCQADMEDQVRGRLIASVGPKPTKPTAPAHNALSAAPKTAIDILAAL